MEGDRGAASAEYARTSDVRARLFRAASVDKDFCKALPNVLWYVLLVGVLTIVSACTSGTESVKLQALQVFCLSLLVSLSLVANDRLR
jgi:hypothetical protein